MYTVICRETVVHTFNIEADSPEKALERFSAMRENGEVEFCDGEPCDMETYIKGEPWVRM